MSYHLTNQDLLWKYYMFEVFGDTSKLPNEMCNLNTLKYQNVSRLFVSQDDDQSQR